MKKTNKIIMIVAIIAILGTVSTAFAATLKSPADIVSDLTGKTTDELYEERAEGKTFGSIAKDAGMLEEFKQKMLEQKKAMLDQRVKDGRISQEQADEIYAAIKENQANCDGTGSAALGRKGGTCFGQGNGSGNGRRSGRGSGMGNNRGMGRGQGCFR